MGYHMSRNRVVGLFLMLAVPAGTAEGQYAPRIERLNIPDSSSEYLFVAGMIQKGLFFVGVVGVVVGVVSVAARFYIHRTATTDPAKLAQNDPWVRAYLREKQGGTAAGPGPVGPPEVPPDAIRAADDRPRPPFEHG
jgi:hypothetical protein